MNIFKCKYEKAFIVFFFLILLFLPLFLESNLFYVSKFSTVIIMAIFVMSLDYLVGRLGLVTLGHAMFYGLGGYIFVMLAPEYEAVNFWLFTLYVMAISAVIALLVGLIVLRTTGVYMIMITLALAQMVFYYFADSADYGGLDGLFIYVKPTTDILEISFFNLEDEIHFYYFCLLSLFNCYVFFKIIINSKFGRVVDALKENPERTTALGYNIFFFRLIAYTLASSLAAYSGYLFALQYGFVNPTFMSWEVSASALVMALLGGLGTVYGAILGTFVYEGLHYFLEHMTHHWMFFMGIMIIAMVLLMKKGLAGWYESLVKRFY